MILMLLDSSFGKVFKPFSACKQKFFMVIWVFVQASRLAFQFLLFLGILDSLSDSTREILDSYFDSCMSNWNQLLRLTSFKYIALSENSSYGCEDCFLCSIGLS